jgi:ribosome-interacting GTPase 1
MWVFEFHNPIGCITHRTQQISIDEFIDVLIGTRKYLPALYVYNKIDAISLETVDTLARTPQTVIISCELGLNLDYLIERMWEALGLVRVYTKKRGVHPDLNDPVCMRKGSTVEVRCNITKIEWGG